MRVGLNLLYLIPGVVGGTETYACSLVRALAELGTDNEFFVFLNAESEQMPLPAHPSIRRVACRVRASRPPLRCLWEQVVLPFLSRDLRLDVLHSLGYIGPVLTFCPTVVTIHDANYWRLRDFIPAGRRIAASGLCRLSAGTCRHIITVSNFSKNEIVELMGVASERVSVVYEGADHWTVASEREPWEQIARRYDLPERYVVALGGGENRHKNLAALIQAFSKACADMPHALVLAGRTPRGLKEEMAGRGQVKAIGRVPDAELAAVVEHADLFVLPSLYEGFGLPVVEAQSAGTPVACSWAGALPEVAGDGALFFDPYSVDQMASAIRRSLRDEGLRRQLKDRGSRNVMRFSWHDAAEKTLEIYRQAAIRN